MKNMMLLIRSFILLTLLLNACGGTQSTVTSGFTFPTVTEPPKTPIPARLLENPIPPLTPIAETILLTTRAGQEVRLKFIRMEPNEYVAFHTESAPDGIPMASGVEIAFKYIAQVDFDLPSPGWDTGSPSATWPVAITLTDGAKITGSMGFKAHHQIHAVGDTDFGPVDVHLTDVQKIVIRRASAPAPIPTDISGENLITVETLSGDIVKVAYPRVFTNCMYDVYCCRYDDITSLPLLSADVSLSEIKSMGFLRPDKAIVTMQDGTSLTTKLRPSTNCPSTAWRIRGKAVLGDFESELKSIHRISR
jgi:hypothetical protein